MWLVRAELINVEDATGANWGDTNEGKRINGVTAGIILVVLLVEKVHGQEMLECDALPAEEAMEGADKEEYF